jgi:hypothetical protein
MTAVMFDHCGQVYAVTLGSYDPMAVEVIKAAVPSFARRWSPAHREWLIDEVYGERLAAALRRINYTVIGVDPPSSGTTVLIQPIGRGQCSSGSDPPGHRWPTNCCPVSVTPITVVITNFSWRSTRPTPNYPKDISRS